MIPDRSEQVVRQSLEPHHELLIAAFRNAVTHFNSMPPQFLLPLVRRKRSRATAIWAYLMDEVERLFTPSTGVRLSHRFESIELYFNDNLVARLKKMSENGFTSNYATGRVKDFHSDLQGELFRNLWSAPLRVDIGYVLDPTGTSVAEIMVAKRSGLRTVSWKYPVLAPAAVQPLVNVDERDAEEFSRIIPRVVPQVTTIGET